MEKAAQHIRGEAPGERDVRREYWRVQVERWKTSGLGQKEYCSKEEIPVERFGYWKRRIEREGQCRPKGLVAVPAGIVSSAFRGQPMLGLVINERYRVEIPETFSPDTLEAVLQVLTRM